MEQAEFDLVPYENRNALLKVVFDTWTPRAHFIIRPRKDCKDKDIGGKDLNNLKPDVRSEVVRLASEMVYGYQLDKFAVLSVHRGSWITTKTHFHAHVCTDVDQYLGVFKDNQDKIPGWPSRPNLFVTKQWRGKKEDPLSKRYQDSVKGYPYRSYYDEERKETISIRNSGSQANAAVGTYEGFKLVYHPSEPKVGFAGEKKEDGVKVLDAMNKFAGERNLTDITAIDEHQGCHLCVVFKFIDHGQYINQVECFQIPWP